MKNGRLRAHLCLFGCFVCLHKQLSFSNHSKSLQTFCVDNCINIIMLTNLCVCFRCIVWVVCLVYKYYLPDVAECGTCIQIHLNILILFVSVIFYIRCKILQNLRDIYHSTIWSVVCKLVFSVATIINHPVCLIYEYQKVEVY